MLRNRHPWRGRFCLQGHNPVQPIGIHHKAFNRAMASMMEMVLS